MIAGGIAIWCLLKEPRGGPPVSLYSAVAAAVDAARAARSEPASGNDHASIALLGNDEHQNDGDALSPDSRHRQHSAMLDTLRSTLLCALAGGPANSRGGEWSSRPAAEQPCATPETVCVETAIRDMLASAIPAVCS